MHMRAHKLTHTHECPSGHIHTNTGALLYSTHRSNKSTKQTDLNTTEENTYTAPHAECAQPHKPAKYTRTHTHKVLETQLNHRHS